MLNDNFPYKHIQTPTHTHTLNPLVDCQTNSTVSSCCCRVLIALHTARLCIWSSLQMGWKWAETNACPRGCCCVLYLSCPDLYLLEQFHLLHCLWALFHTHLICHSLLCRLCQSLSLSVAVFTKYVACGASCAKLSWPLWCKRKGRFLQVWVFRLQTVICRLCRGMGTCARAGVKKKKKNSSVCERSWAKKWYKYLTFI